MSNSESVTEDDHSHQGQRVMLVIAKIITYVVYFYILVVETILFLGFILLLLGANHSSGFVDWVYRSMERAMNPFRGIFNPIELGTIGGSEVQSVFATSVVFAMIVYALMAMVVSALLHWLTSRVARLDKQDREDRRLRAYEQGPGATAEYTPPPMTVPASSSGGDPTGVPPLSEPPTDT